VKKIPATFLLLALLVVVAGCGIAEKMDTTPEPERTIRATGTAAKELADVLAKVKDADSAKGAIGEVDRKFTALRDVIKKLDTVLRDQSNVVFVLADKPKLMNLMLGFHKECKRLEAEGERLNAISDLPSEFWKTCMLRNMDVMTVQLSLPGVSDKIDVDQLGRFLKNVQGLYQKHAYEEVLQVDLLDAGFGSVDEVCAGLQKLAPGATLYHTEIDDKERICLAPIKDFKAIASAIDFGKVVLQNETKVYLRIKIDHEKAMAEAEKALKESERQAKEKREAEEKAKAVDEERRKQEEAKRQAEEEGRRKQEEAERQKKENEKKDVAAAAEPKELSPSDPDYCEKLVEQAVSDDRAKCEKAVEVLLTKTPADVASLETRKKIARAFKRLAEEDHGVAKEKAVRGLVIWGGKHSGPILLKMLEAAQPAAEEQVIGALAEIKYGPAAAVLATKLGDQRLRQASTDALKQLGSDAEDALVKLVRGENQQNALAAIGLLGEIGTRRSLSALGKGTSNRNAERSAACKEALRKVKARLKESKEGRKTV
jgi:hypothetical protein